MTADDPLGGIDPRGGRAAASWTAALAALSPATEWPPQGRLAVVAAHPDDEVLGVGGSLALLPAGATVDIVTVTDGESCFPGLSREERSALAARRRRESRHAHRHLGVSVRRHDLELPDGAISRHHDELVTRLSVVLDRVDHVAVVDPHDGHPDHDSTGRATVMVALHLGMPVTRYAVWAWNWDRRTDRRLRGAVRVDLPSDASRRKAAAVRAHVSQVVSVGGRPPVLPARFLDHHLRGVEVVWQEDP